MDSLALPHHNLGLELRSDPVKGRGVFATRAIAQRTLVDISPILLFPHDEYDQHGKHTQLDHYTYVWKDGYALALGLGSMFNHDSEPNVGFMRDFDNQVIRYVTLRAIAPDEELCISYGAHLWFDDASAKPTDTTAGSDSDDDDGAWLNRIGADDA